MSYCSPLHRFPNAFSLKRVQLLLKKALLFRSFRL
jgi:hypothetical protein